MDMEQVYRALTVLRVPLQRGEYDLHRLVGETLAAAGLPRSMKRNSRPAAALIFCAAAWAWRSSGASRA